MTKPLIGHFIFSLASGFHLGRMSGSKLQEPKKKNNCSSMPFTNSKHAANFLSISHTQAHCQSPCLDSSINPCKESLGQLTTVDNSPHCVYCNLVSFWYISLWARVEEALWDLVSLTYQRTSSMLPMDSLSGENSDKDKWVIKAQVKLGCPFASPRKKHIYKLITIVS